MAGHICRELAVGDWLLVNGVRLRIEKVTRRKVRISVPTPQRLGPPVFGKGQDEAGGREHRLTCTGECLTQDGDPPRLPVSDAARDPDTGPGASTEGQ